MTRIGLAALAAWALATAATAAPKQQFDLACDGTVTRAGATVPYSVKFSVDLKAHTWCEQGCQTARPMARLEPTRLSLREAGPSPLAIDRMTGRLSGADADGSPIDATCKLAPFTPLPNLF
jgi:hypothetical protein